MSVTAGTNLSPARAWLLASRPATLPAAAVPVFVGAGVAFGDGAPLRPVVLFATLVCALLIQIGTNFANDYSDFYRGADNDGRLGPIRATQSGLLTADGVRRGIIVAFALAVLFGGWLAWIGGWPIIAIGVLSLTAGLAYTGGPWPFGYHGLGDVFTFVFFGLIAVSGTVYLQTGTWNEFALLLSVPVGLLVTNILVVNNLRDRATDAVSGKRTLAVLIGDRATRIQYAASATIAFAIPLLVALSDSSHRLLTLPLLTLPMAIGVVSTILKGTSGRDLNPTLERSGKVLLAFGALLALGAALSRPA